MLAIQSSVPCRYNSRMSTNTSALTTIQSSGELEISCQCPASQVCLCEYWSQSALLACWVAQGMHGNAESHCCLLITSITPGDWRAPILKWLIHFNYPPCDHHILINAQSVANSFKGPITTQPSNLKSFIAQLLVKYILPSCKRLKWLVDGDVASWCLHASGQSCVLTQEITGKYNLVIIRAPHLVSTSGLI